MADIFVVGDWHFNHNKEFLYEARGFGSIQEHDMNLITYHNEIVKPDDIVYVLGDCGFGTYLEYLESNIQMLNGKFYLTFGNHDSPKKLDMYREKRLFEDIQMGYRIKCHKSEYILTHYPTIVANGEDQKPVYNIHAHTHQSSPFGEFPKCYCVSLDATDMRPKNLEDIHKEIKERYRNNATANV